MRIMKSSELAKALGVGKSYVTGLRKRPWFPAMHADGWDLAEVQRAMDVNLRRRKTVPSAEQTSGIAPAGQAEPKRPPMVDPDDPRIALLMSGEAEAIDIARTSVQLAARTYAANISQDGAGARDLDNLKRALEELRRSEEGYLDLAERRGNLIQRHVAIAVVGQLVTRMVELLNTVEHLLATQVEIWHEDRRREDLPVEERRALVREWFNDQVRALRTTETDQIEELIRDAQQ